MTAIVIPARNEEDRLPTLLRRVLSINSFQPVIVVVNGCTDDTLRQASKIKSNNLKLLCFEKALGYDVPRAIGAHFAFKSGAEHVIFVDGDMIGNLIPNLIEIDSNLQAGVDLALTNCYPYITRRQPLSTKTLSFRKLLNKKLNLYEQLGIASPSHGPSGISHRLMGYISYRDIAIPPVILALAKKNNLTVKVATAIPHLQLGSKIRDSIHAQKIANTIIGDCIEAKNVFFDSSRNRVHQGEEYIGYHNQRRFDLLEKYLITHR